MEPENRPDLLMGVTLGSIFIPIAGIITLTKGNFEGERIYLAYNSSSQSSTEERQGKNSKQEICRLHIALPPLTTKEV